MTERHISSPQFFITMFVSRVVVTIAINARFTGGESLLDNTVSAFLSMLAALVIALPLWALHARRPGWNTPRAAVEDMGLLGKLVPLLYYGYFVLVNGASLALFQLFLMDTVNPAFSATLVICALTAAALYGALRGIETIARCAACVFVFMLLGCGFVFGIVATRFSPENLEPLFYNGLSQTVTGTLLFIARTSIFADMALLLPMVKGKKGRGFVCWAGGTAVFIGLLVLLVSGCLGRYAYTQNFPVYALASITQVRSMQRLDAVFTGVWMMGLVIKLAVDFYCCRVCLSALQKHPNGMKGGAWAAAVLTLALGLGGTLYAGLQSLLLDTWVLFICTLVTGFGLPLLVLVADLLHKRPAPPPEQVSLPPDEGN